MTRFWTIRWNKSREYLSARHFVRDLRLRNGKRSARIEGKAIVLAGQRTLCGTVIPWKDWMMWPRWHYVERTPKKEVQRLLDLQATYHNVICVHCARKMRKK